jgi:hypothetical protein
MVCHAAAVLWRWPPDGRFDTTTGLGAQRFLSNGEPKVKKKRGELDKPRAEDKALMTRARTHSHVVFTHDLDFGTLLATTGAAATVCPAADLGRDGVQQMNR